MPSIDRSLDRPVYQQIADILRNEINRAIYRQDQPLPSENTLCKRYSVNRRTAQNAYKQLMTEGKVRAVHGAGYFLTSNPPVKRLAFDRFTRRHREAGKADITVEMENAGRRYNIKNDVQILTVKIDEPPTTIADRLNIASTESVLVRSRRYLSEGVPLQIATSYVPLDIAEGTAIMDNDTGPGGIYARIEDKNLTLTRFTEDIKVEPAEGRIAKLLNLGAGATILHLIRTAFAGDRAVEVCDAYMLPAAFELSYELPA